MRVGKYVVTAELGRGSTGVVHSALDPVIGRPVAVKLIRKSELDPAQAKAILQRFQRSAQAAGGLHHTNIVALYEYGEDDAGAWIVMELVQGKSLREHLAAGYRPEPTRLPAVLEQVLEALDYAHGRDIIHGELNPGKVLVSDAGAAKLTDFGASTHADEPADLYAAAILVREVLGGKTGEPDLPAALEAVLAKALAERPDERYASAREFLDALRGAFRSKPAVPNLGALRRAIKAADAAPVPTTARRLPAVLFVDDEERVLNALGALFEGSFEVETATSGAAALERLKTRRFLVVVSDQRMPEMTGVELLKQVRELAPSTVRILLTGYSDLVAIVGSVNESEVFRFVSKPWQQDELRSTLEEAVSVAIALEAVAARGKSAARSHAAALVLGEPAIARAARELSRGAFPVLEAAGSGAALEVLAREEVGVMVCDLEAGSEDPAALLRVLKEHSPQTQLVVASAASDSELVIGLINEARIHRFLAKPVNLTLLQQALGSALERYARLVTAPGLARTERAKPGKDSAQARSLLERIRSLGGRFAKALAGS